MGQAYIGEIRLFGGNFAPVGWLMCNGQLVSIAEYDTLYNLIGTTYGGDGQSTFGLPDLRGRVPVAQGGNFVLGQLAGTETVTLTSSTMPAHNHPAVASNNAQNAARPAGAYIANGPITYIPSTTPNANMAAELTPVGGNQPHENMQPYVVVTFIIATYGIYPSPS